MSKREYCIGPFNIDEHAWYYAQEDGVNAVIADNSGIPVHEQMSRPCACCGTPNRLGNFTSSELDLELLRRAHMRTLLKSKRQEKELWEMSARIGAEKAAQQ